MGQIIANPATYLTQAAFRAQGNDYDLTSYTDPQLSDIVVRASAKADSIMRKSYLLQEQTIRYKGDGSNLIELGVRPIVYVKKAQIVIPGTRGPLIPTDQILIDYASGSVLEYAPMLWQGQGYFARFPRDVPVDFTVGYGCGYAVTPPSVAIADTTGSAGLTPGAYDIAVTAKTFWGETTATSANFTTASGNILITVTPVLGAYLYRAFAAPHLTTPLVLCGESPLTSYGVTSVQILVNSLAAPSGQWQDTLPAVDTSAAPVPSAIVEATRLLALDMLWSQNNLANRGLYKTMSGAKQLMWRSTEGNSGRGVSYTQNQAEELLKPYAFQALL